MTIDLRDHVENVVDIEFSRPNYLREKDEIRATVVYMSGTRRSYHVPAEYLPVLASLVEGLSVGSL